MTVILCSWRQLWWIIIILLGFGLPLSAQTSAYHSVLFPYDVGSRHPASIGSLINGNTGDVLSARLNPAAAVFMEQPVISVNTILDGKILQLKCESEMGNSDHSDVRLVPGEASALWPLQVFNQKIALAANGYYISAPQVEVWEEFSYPPTFTVDHQRSGKVGVVEFALSGKLVDRLGIGFSVSRWLGHWSWQDKINNEPLGSGTFHYSGTSFSLGFLYRWPLMQAGLTLYAPFTVMTSSDLKNEWWINAGSYKLRQNAGGAARIGVTVNPSLHSKIGIGYRWAGPVQIKKDLPDISSASRDYSYTQSHQITFGIEYAIAGSSWNVPVFAAYQATFMPTTKNEPFDEYQVIKYGAWKNLQHTVAGGTQIMHKSWAIQLSTTWEKGAVFAQNTFSPPYS